MKRILVACAALAAFAPAGCGGPRVVAVSGVVTVDDKPCPNLIVSFQPLGDKDNPNPGRGSSAVTDEQGRYKLVYDGEKPGALVGRHRVRIFPRVGAEKGPDDGVFEKPKTPARVQYVPMEWNEKSDKEFVVPRGGT